MEFSYFTLAENSVSDTSHFTNYALDTAGYSSFLMETGFRDLVLRVQNTADKTAIVNSVTDC